MCLPNDNDLIMTRGPDAPSADHQESWRDLQGVAQACFTRAVARSPSSSLHLPPWQKAEEQIAIEDDDDDAQRTGASTEFCGEPDNYRAV